MIDLVIKEGNNCFYIGENEKENIAIITYYFKGDLIIAIDHTFVSPELRGQNIAAKLLSKVIEFAKENEFKIIPVCSYAVKKMARNDEYQDILFYEK